MIRRFFILMFIGIIALGILQITGISNSNAGIDAKTKLKLKLKKPDIVDSKFIEGGRWRFAMGNDGRIFYDNKDVDGDGHNEGGIFPRGQSTGVIDAAGPWIGTIKNGVPVVSEMQYWTEFQPGRILNSGVSFYDLQADSVNHPGNRVYIIDQSKSGSDWTEWPQDAPRDENGDPALIADVQTWAVFNDLDTSLSYENRYSFGNPGIGLEIHLETFSFNSSFLRDAVFLKYTIINRTNQIYPSSYFGLWTDFIVSDSPLYGSDSTRGLGYNSYPNYEVGNEPYAVGIDILQGPVEKLSSLSPLLAQKFQSRNFKLNYNSTLNSYEKTLLSNNTVNLSATAFSATCQAQEPTLDYQRYDMMRGIPFRVCGQFVNGWLNPGPPESILGSGVDPAVLATGPFTLFPGEPQEIWAAVIGGHSDDRLGAVSRLFASDDMIQRVFDAGFVAPTAPPVPQTEFSIRDGLVMLTWKDNAEYVPDTFGEKAGITKTNGFSSDYKKYDFQGYRVYRSLTGLEGSFALLAQYDMADTLGSIYYRSIDQNDHLISSTYNFGDNTGLRYAYVDSNLINGHTYYYSVTSYDAQPFIESDDSIFVDGVWMRMPSEIPVSMESSQADNLFSVTPMKPILGTVTGAGAMADTAAHTQGYTTTRVTLRSVFPDQMKNTSYRIEFFKLADSIDGHPVVYGPRYETGQTAYRIIDLSDNSIRPFSNRMDDPRSFIDVNANTVFDEAEDLPLDDALFHTAIAFSMTDQYAAQDYGIVDGVELILQCYTGATVTYDPGTIFQSYNLSDNRWYSGPGNFIYGNGIFEFTEQFRFGLGGVEKEDRHDIDLVFSRDPSSWQMIYRHGNIDSPSHDTTLAPFRVYDVDPSLKGTPRQINVNFRDRDNFDAWTLDGQNTISGGVGSFNYTYFDTNSYDVTKPLNFYSSPYDQPSYGIMRMGYRGDLISATPNPYAMALSSLYVAARGAGSDGGTAITYAERHQIFKNWIDNGTLKIRVGHYPASKDRFEFTVSSDRKLTSKKERRPLLKDICVVPNPYYTRIGGTLESNRVQFTHLPERCTIRIFTIAGDLVKTLHHDENSSNGRPDPTYGADDGTPDAFTSTEYWDLKTEEHRMIAAGMYVALITSSAGKTMIKFAVIR